MANGSAAEAIDARVVKALSHPTRVRILELLQQNELASPVELSQELDIPLGTVSYHVRRLEQLGFIELATRTQRRGAIEHHYRARAALDAPRRSRRDGAGARTPATGADEQVRETLERAQAALPAGGFDAVEARADGRELTLDATGVQQAHAALKACAAKLARIEQASARRIAVADGAAEPRSTRVLLALFGLG